MSDDEMRKLAVPKLQDEGYIFLWVTGRYDARILIDSLS
jgi:mRNA (2'-O-methyladenosine-N6-)-methyltransferase